MGEVSVDKVPAGYAWVEGGSFSPSDSRQPVEIEGLAMKQTPVTNEEWTSVVSQLGEDRVVLLDHNPLNHPTQIVGIGKTATEVVEDLDFPRDRIDGVDFDGGRVLVAGSLVLLKLVDEPSAKYDGVGHDGIERKFSGLKQPLVGASYPHGEAWMLLESLEEAFLGEDAEMRYPTDGEFEYVASDGGTKEYGTPDGKLRNAQDEKQIHVSYVDERTEIQTADVDDNRYPKAADLPMRIQTTGNVWRRIAYNKQQQWPYGLRGGSWYNSPARARVTYRYFYNPDYFYFNVGFSPVVVPQGSQARSSGSERVELYSRRVLERLRGHQTQIARGAAQRLRAMR